MKPTLLLVEDNRLNRTLFRDILERDFDVLEAESAEAAREFLEDEAPDIVLLDLQLPGMDGLTFLKMLKRDPRKRAIPVVVVSAHAMRENIQQARDAGCLDYITKPITDPPDVFAQRILGYLGKRRLGDEVNGRSYRPVAREDR